MSNKHEGTFAIISAILVLFSAMFKPLISVILAVSLFIIFAIYKFIKK
jgi:hypothetical protein